MKEVENQIRTHLMNNYEEIIGETPIEKFPGTFFPHVLAEFIQRDEKTLQVSCHIGVECESEDKIEEIRTRLEASLGQLEIRGHLWHYGGVGVTQHVAVNEKENLFIQQPVHFIVTEGEPIKDPKEHIL